MHALLQELEESVACKYVAVEAVKALNQIYKALHEAAPGEGQYLRLWAEVLLRPEMLRYYEACSTLEQAAIAAATGPARNPAAVNGKLLCPTLSEATIYKLPTYFNVTLTRGIMLKACSGLLSLVS